jgi:hypothetical protein
MNEKLSLGPLMGATTGHDFCQGVLVLRRQASRLRKG